MAAISIAMLALTVPALTMPALTMMASAAAHDPEPTAFDAIVSAAPARLVEIVRQVANDTTIRGSHEYEKETSLNAAEAQPNSSAFPAWTAGGQVFFKVRRQVLSPAHFFQSTDIGTVTVRYVVQPSTSGGSELRIEAVFIEDGHRHKPHVSDGSVEAAEYKAIAEHLHAIEQQEQEAREQAKRDSDEKETTALLSSITEENARIAAATRDRAALEKRVQELRRSLSARVKTAGVPLKSAPYNHAPTLLPLGRDEMVTVLEATPFWLRVREPQGQEGWVYRLLVEVQP
ncbi:MAG: hypothetical protein GZ088_05735 [Acidipila sp.]|nr:hypothetical protein [Acidipila sp.]